MEEKEEEGTLEEGEEEMDGKWEGEVKEDGREVKSK